MKRFVSISMAIACAFVVGLVAPVQAQEATPAASSIRSGATIEVTGTGIAGATAESAIVQMVVYSNGFVGMDFEESVAIDSAATPAAFPDDFYMQPVVTEEDVAAIVTALETAGVPSEMIETRLADALIAGYYGNGVAIIALQLNAPQIGQVTEIVAAGRTVATNRGLSIDQVNVAYQIADCTAVNKAASAAAFADAKVQAAELAEVLGVELGDIVKVSKQSIYDGLYFALLTPLSACDQQLTLEDAFSTYFAASPVVNEGLIEVYAAIVLTYEVA